MKILAIIPARGGSKGIPKKNLALLGHKPLIRHATDAAVESSIFDRIIVSSDDEAIIQCALTCPGVESPFLRPAELAEDHTSIKEVIRHLLEYLYKQENYSPDAFMLLEPTCPLRNAEDIQNAYALFDASSCESLLSISPVQQHPSDMIYRDQGRWSYCLDRQKITRGRQDFKEAFFINGAIYITKIDYFLKTDTIYDLTCCATYEMPRERSFDIDTPFDLALVRSFLTMSQHTTEGKEYAEI